jgi:hypothetical protein
MRERRRKEKKGEREDGSYLLNPLDEIVDRSFCGRDLID